MEEEDDDYDDDVSFSGVGLRLSCNFLTAFPDEDLATLLGITCVDSGSLNDAFQVYRLYRLSSVMLGDGIEY
jgi:hypothetical protein